MTPRKMNQKSAANVGEVRDLRAESLRLTAFPAPSAQLTATGWWAELVGSVPDTTTSKPSQGELQEVGRIGENNLILQVQPLRVDWLLAPRFDQDTPTEWKREVGPFSEALNIFVPLMIRWLARCPPIARLAFGATVYEPVKNRSAGYRRLSEYLPNVKIDPEGSTDFFYQINRPRKSDAVDGLVINRLSKWSCAAFVPLRFVLTPQSVQHQLGNSEQACRIELDINTAAEFQGELPAGKLQPIFEQLVTFGEEIIATGDVP